jgi:hypothetical protein
MADTLPYLHNQATVQRLLSYEDMEEYQPYDAPGHHAEEDSEAAAAADTPTLMER